jgi:hypothetical protein
VPLPLPAIRPFILLQRFNLLLQRFNLDDSLLPNSGQNGREELGSPLDLVRGTGTRPREKQAACRGAAIHEASVAFAGGDHLDDLRPGQPKPRDPAPSYRERLPVYFHAEPPGRGGEIEKGKYETHSSAGERERPTPPGLGKYEPHPGDERTHGARSPT